MREIKPTLKDVPSSDINDLFFNSGKVDEFVTSLQHSYADRFGKCHRTVEGMNWVVDQLIEQFKIDINQAIIAAGYITLDSFQQGADLPNNELTQRNHILRDETTGEYYRWDGDLPKQVPVGSTPQSTGGVGKGKWLMVNLRSVITAIDDYGASDSSSNNTEILNSATSANIGNLLFGKNADYRVDGNYENKGALIDPSARIVKPITGGLQQLNTYANNCSYAVGHEYLYRLYFELNEGMQGINTYIYGDSTVTTGYTSGKNHLTNFILNVFKRKGIYTKPIITNRGVGGTSVTSLNVLPDLIVNRARLIFIKYGINDGRSTNGNALEFANNLRSKLKEIRNDPNGSVNDLAIVLVGPNSTSDTPNHRDEYWYEQLRGVYEQAARDYRCFYFDTYAYLRDSRFTAGRAMDDAYGDGRAIHPRDTMQPMIWGAILDEMLGFSETTEFRTNHFTNTDAYYEVAKADDLPATYTKGISIKRALPENGFPINGQVITYHQSRGAMLQINSSYSAGSSLVSMRTGHTSGYWNKWSSEEQSITLLNGWVNLGSTWGDAKASVDTDGYVTLSGVLSAEPAQKTSGTVIGKLPAGITLKNGVLVAAMALSGAGGGVEQSITLNITAAGEIVLWNAFPSTPRYLTLSGVVFKI